MGNMGIPCVEAVMNTMNRILCDTFTMNKGIIIWMVLAVAGCDLFSAKTYTPGESYPLTETYWWLEEFDEVDGFGEEVEAFGEGRVVNRPLLRLLPDDAVDSDSRKLIGGGSFWFSGDTVTAGSNSYSARYQTDNFSLEVEGVISTEAGEPRGSVYFEYLGVLDRVERYLIEGDALILFYDDDEKTLHFRADNEAGS